MEDALHESHGTVPGFLRQHLLCISAVFGAGQSPQHYSSDLCLKPARNWALGRFSLSLNSASSL